ncbi:MAG: hypothetical protein EXS58_12820 [Candidatus Latescibacteria bacterium]|nr:hypothetical protein [Candidatus Latescibacterota bacterium]
MTRLKALLSMPSVRGETDASRRNIAPFFCLGQGGRRVRFTLSQLACQDFLLILQLFYNPILKIMIESQKTMWSHVFFCEIHRLILYPNRTMPQDLDLWIFGCRRGGKNLQEGDEKLSAKGLPPGICHHAKRRGDDPGGLSRGAVR